MVLMWFILFQFQRHIHIFLKKEAALRIFRIVYSAQVHKGRACTKSYFSYFISTFKNLYNKYTVMKRIYALTKEMFRTSCSFTSTKIHVILSFFSLFFVLKEKRKSCFWLRLWNIFRVDYFANIVQCHITVGGRNWSLLLFACFKQL